MKGWIRRPSPSMVVALIALVIAMGGTGWAAVSITGKQVKDSSLTGADIKNNTVASADVKDKSLLAKDFKSGQLPAGAQGAQGPAGPQGPKGDKGDKGDTGPATGPAGGDLSGSYPNPSISGNAVNSGKVEDNSLTGDDINEVTLGQVPNADTVDGLDARSFSFRANTNTGTTTLGTLGDLTLKASCSLFGDLTVTAESARDNTSLHVALTSAGGASYFENDNFDTGASLDFLTTDDDVQGTLTHVTPFSFLSGGSVTTVTFMAEEAEGLGATRACLFAGTGMTSNSTGIIISPPPIGP